MNVVINGVTHLVCTDPDTSLLDVIRDDLGLLGTEYGCGEDRCGACSVLLGGKVTHSCAIKLTDVKGKPITTIEGLSNEPSLVTVQKALLEEDAFPCGNCVPGIVVSAVALLCSNPHPTESQIAEHMANNYCRCGGTARMLEAILKSSRRP